MGKKNEFVFNIGFNRENPDHVEVVRILNQKGRGKAEYLARAVLAFEMSVETIPAKGESFDYQTLEVMVRRILREQCGEEVEENSGEDLIAEGEDVAGILQVLSGFRK